MGDSQEKGLMAFEKHEALFCIGLATYWGFLHLVSFVPFGSFYDSDGAAWAFLALLGAVSALAAALFAPFLERAARKVVIAVIGTMLAVVGGLVVVFGLPFPWAIAGVALVMFEGPLCVFPLLGLVGARLSSPGSLPKCVYCGMALSFFIFLLGFALPFALAVVLCACLPIASCVCLVRALHIVEKGGVGALSGGSEQAEGLKRYFPLKPSLVCYMVVFSLALNYTAMELSSTSNASLTGSDGVACIFLSSCILLACLVGEYFANVRGLTVMPAAIAFLATMALLMWMIAGGESSPVVMPLVVAGYFLFVSAIVLRALQEGQIASKSATACIAECIFCNMVGLLLGSLLSRVGYAADGLLTSMIVAAVVCAFFALTMFILPKKTARSLFLVAGSSDTDEGLNENPYALDMERTVRKRAELAGERFSLTEREVDILCYLIRGWTLQSMADEETVSRNTIKTHVTHIYQKMGVHTREECLMLIEGL